MSVTAAPAAGYIFDHWSGDCTGSNDCSVTLDSDKSVTAVFVPYVGTYTLTVNQSAGGLIEPPTASYTSGTVVNLTATPNTGYHFVSWSGACSGTITTCSVTMDANKTVSATFAITTYILTVTRPTGRSIAPTTDTYNYGTVVELTATPSTGYHFVAWTGACSGIEPTCSVTMDANKSVTAIFTAVPVVTPTRYEQDHSYLVYLGAWSTVVKSTDSAGSYAVAKTAGASVTARFTGTAVTYIARKGSAQGVAKVTLDDRPAVYVDLYSYTTVYKQAVWSASGLTDGPHTLKIEWTGMTAAGTGTNVNLDALDIVGLLVSGG